MPSVFHHNSTILEKALLHSGSLSFIDWTNFSVQFSYILHDRQKLIGKNNFKLPVRFTVCYH